MKAAKPNRRKCREAALQVLFCQNFNNQETAPSVAAVQGAAAIEFFRETQGTLREVAQAAEAAQRALDQAIKRLSDIHQGARGGQIKATPEGTASTITHLAAARKEAMTKLQRCREILQSQDSVFGDKSFTLRLLDTFSQHEDRINYVLDRTVQRWSLRRLTGEDKALMQLGLTEILYFDDVPAAVAIDEYVELSKQYSDKEGPGLINGVLDAAAKENAGGANP